MALPSTPATSLPVPKGNELGQPPRDSSGPYLQGLPQAPVHRGTPRSHPVPPCGENSQGEGGPPAWSSGSLSAGRWPRNEIPLWPPELTWAMKEQGPRRQWFRFQTCCLVSNLERRVSAGQACLGPDSTPSPSQFRHSLSRAMGGKTGRARRWRCGRTLLHLPANICQLRLPKPRGEVLRSSK